MRMAGIVVLVGVLIPSVSQAAGAPKIPFANKDLFANLFGGQPGPSPKAPTPAPPLFGVKPQPQPPMPSQQAPRVVCGMTLVPTDPKLDPKIRRVPPQNGVKFSMKRLSPPICAP